MPKKCVVGKGCTLTAILAGTSALDGNSLKIEWGDGTFTVVPLAPHTAGRKPGKRSMRSKKMPLEVTHRYAHTGSVIVKGYIPHASGNGNHALFEKPLIVTEKKPVLSLRQRLRRRGANTQVFYYHVQKGSYPVTRWTFDLGDGTVLSGTGQAKGKHPHVFQKRGTYKAVLTARDSKGNAATCARTFRIKRTLSLSRRSPPERDSQKRPPATGIAPVRRQTILTSLEDVEFSKKQEGIHRALHNALVKKTLDAPDFAPVKSTPGEVAVVSVTVPEQFMVGMIAFIDVFVENAAATDIAHCAINLDTDDIFTVKQTLSLKQGEKKKARFQWTPKEAGSQEISIYLDCPQLGIRRAQGYKKSVLIQP